ncbi:MAG: peptidoglycan-binding protein [Myxococcaceae bacterium]|nr:peptidoglycan-binding protein [Myxococcaceae bacterium]
MVAPISNRVRNTSATPDVGAGLASAANGEYLKRGSSGEAVLELQKALNARGWQLEEDGKFGPKTEQALRDFQGATGAEVDGVVGPETVGKLRTTAGQQVNRRDPAAPSSDYQPNRPAPVDIGRPSGDERQRYDYYASMVRRAGGQVCPNGQPTVLGLRAGEGGAAREYKDRFIVLTPNGRVHEFTGATYPGQSRSSASPDVTGDGVGDVGMIRPGNYQVVPNGNHAGAASYHVRTLGGSGSIPGWRDSNHDGRYSDGERGASERRGDRLTGVLFHQGNSSAPSSIGCQTLSPSEYRRFIDAVGGPRGSFTYTLIAAR